MSTRVLCSLAVAAVDLLGPFGGLEAGHVAQAHQVHVHVGHENLFEIPPADIASLKPALTMADGRVVYEA